MKMSEAYARILKNLPATVPFDVRVHLECLHTLALAEEAGVL